MDSGLDLDNDNCKPARERRLRPRGRFRSVILFGVFGLVFLGSYLTFNAKYCLHVRLGLRPQWLKKHPDDPYEITFERHGTLHQKIADVLDETMCFYVPVDAADFRPRGLTDADVTFLTINDTGVRSFGEVPAALKAEKKRLQATFLLLSTAIAASTILTILLAIWLWHHHRVLHGWVLGLARYQRPWLKVFWVLFTLDLGFNLHPECGVGLDPSWMWGINQVADRAGTFGKEVVFTYGPLGFLLGPYGYGNHFYLALLFNVGLALLILGLFTIYQRFGTDAREKLAIFGVMWLFCFGFHSIEWVCNFLVLFAAMLLWTLQERSRYFFGLTVLLASIAAVELFLKFNSATLAVGTTVLFGVGLWFRSPKRFTAFLLLYGATYAAIVSAGVVALFAGIGNFLQWLRLSCEIARGYNTVMARPAGLFFLLLAVTGICIWARLVLRVRRQDARFGFLAILSAPYLFFAFKHGFVRADETHLPSYFSALPFAMGLLYLFSPTNFIKTTRSAFISSAALAAIYFWFHFPSTLVVKSTLSNLKAIVLFDSTRKSALAQQAEAFHKETIPDWNPMIGAGSIEVLPCEMSYALANQWSGWQPYPAFQLYTAYTSVLDNFGAASFSGTNAPRFVMVSEFSDLDRRNMFLDTPATWNTVLLNYSVLRQDRKKALLVRKSSDALPAFEHTGDTSCRFGETINIPASQEYVYARILIEPTLAGRVWSLIYRGGLPEFVVRFQNGDERRYRVATETLSTPVLLSHVPNNLREMLELQQPRHAAPFEIVSFKFNMGESPSFLYKNRIKIEWLRPATR